MLKIWLLVVFLPDFNFLKAFAFFLLMSQFETVFQVSTRSFLIFALHLLFSFQGAFAFRLCSFSEQISEECFLFHSSQICFESAFFEIWWAQVDSNHRPHAYQACALTG